MSFAIQQVASFIQYRKYTLLKLYNYPHQKIRKIFSFWNIIWATLQNVYFVRLPVLFLPFSNSTFSETQQSKFSIGTHCKEVKQSLQIMKLPTKIIGKF